MKHDVIVPSSGESIREVYIGEWRKKTGDIVRKDEILVDLETQKATFQLQAEYSGRLEVLKPDRDAVVKPGDRIAIIDDSVRDNVSSADAPQASTASVVHVSGASRIAEETARNIDVQPQPIMSPAARKIAAEKKLDLDALRGTGRGSRVTKEDVLRVLEPKATPSPVASLVLEPTAVPVNPAAVLKWPLDTKRGERAEPASRIRRQIAENLVASQRSTATLTTFNEVDMSQVIVFRKKNNPRFEKKYGVSVGMVSFFAQAAIRALKEHPVVNATFTGEEIIYRDFVDLGIAVSTERGLVVPVVRDAQKLTVVEFEKEMSGLAKRAQAGKLSIPEMTGGTFTITNGGVFGSLLSTPILNRPQSAILGLHKIQERPVALKKRVAIRPMMYLSLSYDHRLIDGRDAVLFLVKIKEGIENLDLVINKKI